MAFSAAEPTAAPRTGRAFFNTVLGVSKTIENLIGPESFQRMQRLGEGRELFGADAADLLDRAHMLLIERIDDVTHLTTLFGELDAHRAAVDPRTLMVEEAHLDELLEIVGNIGAEVVAAGTELARGQLLFSGIVHQQCLHGIDIGAAAAIPFLLC